MQKQQIMTDEKKTIQLEEQTNKNYGMVLKKIDSLIESTAENNLAIKAYIDTAVQEMKEAIGELTQAYNSRLIIN